MLMSRTLVGFLALVASLALLTPVFLVVGLALVFAAGVRAVARLLEPAFVPWPDLLIFDAALGWKPRANLDTHYLAEFDDVFRVVTDGEGWPGRRSVDESDSVVIGDSFVFGYGIDTARSFAEINPRLKVKGIGAPGYSMVQGVLLMEELGVRLRGKLVVWFIFTENDLQDNLRPEMRTYRAPFARRGPGDAAWTIASAHLQPNRWRCSDLDKERIFGRMFVDGPISARAYSACEFLIDRADAACRRAGARLVVVTIPHPLQLTPAGLKSLACLSKAEPLFNPDLPDQRIAGICRSSGVPFVSGQTRLARADYKRREGIHWNQRGHRRVAALLEELTGAFRSGALDGYVPRERFTGASPRVPCAADAVVAAGL